MTEDEKRKAFEAWIKSPPYERSTLRFENDSNWGTQYVDYKVEMAWKGFLEGFRIGEKS